MSVNDLMNNIDRLRTTSMGCDRIKRNLLLNTDDVIEWCKEKICQSGVAISRKGKNWYVKTDDIVLTVNATSYTVITAHKISIK